MNQQPDTNVPASAPPPAGKPQRPRWMRLLGLQRRHGKRLTFLKLKPTLWGWILLFMVVGLLGMGAFAEYSMQPDFCRSCHIMEPYFQAWHQSTHKNVACAMCHFEPGLANTLKGKWQASSQAVKYITGTYGSKPHAEIKDESCLRSGCHEKRILEGKVAWKATSHRGHQVQITFDHTPHMKEGRLGKTLRCVSCHSQIVQGQHIVVTLDTCFLCHFKGKGLEHGRSESAMLGSGCRACHGAPKGEIRLATGVFTHARYVERKVPCQNCHAETVRGDGAVPRQVCWNCHNNPSHIAKYEMSELIHTNHVTNHKVECSSCHVQIEHYLGASAPVMTARKGEPSAGKLPVFEAGACGSCHTQTHAGPLELYRGIGGRGVPDAPSPMYRTQVNCVGCHKTLQKSAETAGVTGQTYVTGDKDCQVCHEHKYDGEIQRWKAAVAEALTRAQGARDQARVLLADAEEAARARQGLAPDSAQTNALVNARSAFADAEHNIRLVTLGRGVHNVTYALSLLNRAVAYCAEARECLKPSAPATRPAP